jgi:serine/threonine protein kinase
MKNTIIKDYQVKSELGQGGMATVYLAHDIKFQTNVAIKVLNKEYVHNDNIRKRFIAEARNMYKMSHPNIIKVNDLIDDGDKVAFVMEFIEGETLKEYLECKGKLSDAEIKAIFSQMLDAVGYVHDKKLVHRDIKPSNFMINSEGQVKLLDFGIAKNTDTNSADYTQTGTTQNMGTPMYMSPEQIKSTKDVTLQSDIYSLGVVLWQMVMGKKPYDTNTSSTYELQNKIVTQNLSLTNTLFDSVIEVATAKELNIRFNNCKELKSKLESLDEIDNERNLVYNPPSADDKTLIQVDNKNGQEHKEKNSINNLIPNRKNKLINYLLPGLLLLMFLNLEFIIGFISPYNVSIMIYYYNGFIILIISIIFLILGYWYFKSQNQKENLEMYRIEKRLIYYLLPGILLSILTYYQLEHYTAEYFWNNGEPYIFYYTYNLYLDNHFLTTLLVLSLILIISGYFMFINKSKLLYNTIN